MHMLLTRKLLLTLPVLVLVSVASFSLITLIPGDAATAILGDQAPHEALVNLRAQLGLNHSPPVQYVRWISAIAHGDFGNSVKYNQPVISLISERIAPTLWLAGGALVLCTLISIPAGILAAQFRGSVIDRLLTYLTTLGIAMPDFWVGALLVFVFAVTLRKFPSSGYVNPLTDPAQGFRHLVLPWIALAAGSTAAMTRMVRSGLLDVLGQDYIRTARAKGLGSGAVLRRHALRNGMLTVLTLFGLIARQLVGGAVIIETLYSIPGIGSLVVNSVISKDFPVIQILVLYLGAGVVLINLCIDLSYGVLDPRIRQL